MDAEYLKAIILGVVQGITEFLPISSKGHLVIIQEPLSRWLGTPTDEQRNLELIVALHLGTLLAIGWVYRSDLMKLSVRMCAAIVLATVPLVIAALLFKKYIEPAYASPVFAACGLLFTSLLLFLGQRLSLGEQTLERVPFRTALCVGLFQMLAIAPGVSRSGTTIVGGCFGGLRRDAAANFSFLIAIPAIAGASVLMLKDTLEGDGAGNSLPVMGVGILTSFIVGLAAIRWLLRMIAKGRLHWFAWYCLVAGIVVIVWQLLEPAATTSPSVGIAHALSAKLSC
ncbi:MAG: undecaprenyl-diphosphate phosphatase [Planctomycetaceae bacterium]